MKIDKQSMEFFETLADSVAVFRSGMPMPDANCKGCSVVLGKGKDAGIIRFGFLAKGDNVVMIDLDASSLMADPQEYIGNMLEALNQGLEQMKRDVKIIVPTGPRIH